MLNQIDIIKSEIHNIIVSCIQLNLIDETDMIISHATYIPLNEFPEIMTYINQCKCKQLLDNDYMIEIFNTSGTFAIINNDNTYMLFDYMTTPQIIKPNKLILHS